MHLSHSSVEKVRGESCTCSEYHFRLSPCRRSLLQRLGSSAKMERSLPVVARKTVGSGLRRPLVSPYRSAPATTANVHLVAPETLSRGVVSRNLSEMKMESKEMMILGSSRLLRHLDATFLMMRAATTWYMLRATKLLVRAWRSRSRSERAKAPTLTTVKVRTTTPKSMGPLT